MDPQDTPHLDRLRAIYRHENVRWFEHGQRLKMSMIDEALREEKLITFEQDGYIYLTPAALKILIQIGIHNDKPLS